MLYEFVPCTNIDYKYHKSHVDVLIVSRIAEVIRLTSYFSIYRNVCRAIKLDRMFIKTTIS